MTWRPIVTEADARARIVAVLADIATALPEHASAADGHDEAADHALLRTYLASDDVIVDEEGVAPAALATAIERGTGVHRPALFGGVSRIGWTIAHLAHEDTANEACSAIDQALWRVLVDWEGDYDLIGGVVGFGVYALERGHHGAALADCVLDWLEAHAVSRHGGLAWFTPPELLIDDQRAMAPEGYWNLGLAHGMPGVIGLLARFVSSDLFVDRAGKLLELAVAHLIAAEPGRNEDGRFRSWQPAEAATKRLAWCYGDLGVAATLVGAGILAERPAWREEGLMLARSCAWRSRGEAAITDAGICHGAFGIAHLFNRMAQATGDGSLAAAASRWLDEGLAMRANAPIAGWPAMWIDQHGRSQRADATLLSGAAGVGLVLHAAISEIEPSWDRLLLVDVPPL